MPNDPLNSSNIPPKNSQNSAGSSNSSNAYSNSQSTSSSHGSKLNRAVNTSGPNDIWKKPQPEQVDDFSGKSFEVLKKHLPANRPITRYESENDKSRVEDMKKKLYSKSISGIDHVRRPVLHEHSEVVTEKWQETEEEKPAPKREPIQEIHHRNSVMKKVLIFSILFFLGAVGYAAYVISNGTNVVSSENIDMIITGPASVASGDPLTLDVELDNRNNDDIILADLVMTYPEGTRRSSTDNAPIINDRINVGTIKPNQIIKKRIQVALFAEEGSKKNIKMSLEYRIPGSTTIFRKQKDLAIQVGNSPISLTIDTVNEITVGQDVVLNLDIKSNSTQVIKNTLLKATYPFGFKFKNATPDASVGNDTWSLGDIAPNSEQKIKIVGTMVGDESQDRVFKFNVGTIDPKDETKIGTSFVAANTELAVKKSFIASDIILNAHSDPMISIPAGELVQGEITWQNNLDVPINDVVIEAKLSGPFLDRTSVRSEPGFFRSTDNTIVWDKSNLEDLQELKPGGTGRVVFSFASQQPTDANLASIRNPAITVDLTIHGTRLNENNVPQDVKSIVTKIAKVHSEMALHTRLVRKIGPFVNTGPFPTVAEKTTTFTAMVNVSNSFNTVKGAVYKTTLPNYVKWLGQTNPARGVQASYDDLTRTITWNVGDVPAGTGYSVPAKEFDYQVSFLPSLSQVNGTPIITKEQSVSGTDSFTNTSVEASDVPLDIKISTDPGYKFGDDHVLAP